MWIQVFDNEKVSGALQSSSLSKSEICQIVGIHLPALCKFERCGFGLSERKLVSLAEALGCDCRDWLVVPSTGRAEEEAVRSYLFSVLEEALA